MLLTLSLFDASYSWLAGRRHLLGAKIYLTAHSAVRWTLLTWRVWILFDDPVRLLSRSAKIHPRRVFCSVGCACDALTCPMQIRSQKMSAPIKASTSVDWWNRGSASCKLRGRLNLFLLRMNDGSLSMTWSVTIHSMSNDYAFMCDCILNWTICVDLVNAPFIPEMDMFIERDPSVSKIFFETKFTRVARSSFFLFFQQMSALAHYALSMTQLRSLSSTLQYWPSFDLCSSS